jgi:inorganic pyrophosphatase
MNHNASFWYEMILLAATNSIVIDRPKGSTHPRYHELIYPFDYGYLENTTASDGGGIDVWLGSLKEKTLTGILCTLDTLKHNAEIKLLIGCTEADIQIIQDFHNERHTLYIPKVTT